MPIPAIMELRRSILPYVPEPGYHEPSLQLELTSFRGLKWKSDIYLGTRSCYSGRPLKDDIEASTQSRPTLRAI
eukprot:CAMPEP_0205902450 /NCGR_PEP_ID=MMETSP1083-20121108/28224_1 /ASSEMBLY_ACC=CAM_ASM_000430 /TAXON_ID=97485 /ORGANISM="Prymnesium parvum, Strain Texoma1" /LENGTH=73 /DNA_ID=CAMNT_0053268051 /DNA_START=123 /DNA_END=344 /DNA_ORIENTATION=-